METKRVPTFRQGRHFGAGLFMLAIMVIGIQIKIVNGAGVAHSSASRPALLREEDNLEVEWKQIVGTIQPGNTVGSGTGLATGGGQPGPPTGAMREANLARARFQ